MKAMILAAGRGERMGARTERVPKPLLEVGGRPLIEHQILRLGAAGFRDIGRLGKRRYVVRLDLPGAANAP